METEIYSTMKTLLINFFLVFIAVGSSAQIENWKKTVNPSTDTNYFKIKQRFYEYYEGLEHEELSAGDKRAAKMFRRYEYFMEPRVDADGKLDTYYQAIKSHSKLNDFGSRTQQLCVNNSVNWESLGPFHTQYNVPSTGYASHIKGVGRVNCIATAPTNHQTIYIGTGAGIFKTTDGGANWNNVTDITALPGLYIQDVAVSPFDENIAFATAHIGDPHISDISYG